MPRDQTPRRSESTHVFERLASYILYHHDVRSSLVLLYHNGIVVQKTHGVIYHTVYHRYIISHWVVGVPFTCLGTREQCHASSWSHVTTQNSSPHPSRILEMIMTMPLRLHTVLIGETRSWKGADKITCISSSML